MNRADLKERVLGFVLGIFLLFTFSVEYSTEDKKGILLAMSFYYGLVGLFLAIGWDWLFKNSDIQHKSEEGC